MKQLSVLALILLSSANAMANCEANFIAEGDPRNGAEFSSSAQLAGVTAVSALGQLQAIAAADGFSVLGEELTDEGGTLTIEQVQGVRRARTFLIRWSAEAQADGATVSVQTRLPREMKARPEDIRAGMCGMIARIKPGAEGEAIAAQARKNAVAAQVTTIEARWLAQDIYRMRKRLTPEVVSARQRGKPYALDGQVSDPLEVDGTIELWYKTFIPEGAIIEFNYNRESVAYPAIVCRMAADQTARAKKLTGGDWAKLSGVVSEYRDGQPGKLILNDCRFN